MKTRYLSISPFSLLAIFYLAINFYYAVNGYIDGSMLVELEEKEIAPDSVLIAFLLQVISVSMIGIIYCFCTIKSSNVTFSSKWGKGVLLIQICYLFYTIYYKANMAGVDIDYKGPLLYKYLFIALQPDILFLIISPNIKNKKLFSANAVVYLVSNLMRGWAGGFLILVLVIIIRKGNIKLKNIFTLFCLSIVIILISPFIFEIKWGLREGNTDLLEKMINIDYINHLHFSINYIFNRFQHVGHIALLIDNANYFITQYDSGNILPYWREGLLPNLLFKFYDTDSKPLQQISMQYIFDGDPNSLSSMNIGMMGWLTVLDGQAILYVLYILFLLILPFCFLSKYGNQKTKMTLTVMAILYLFHGWIYAYVDLIFYTIIIVLIKNIKIKYLFNNGVRGCSKDYPRIMGKSDHNLLKRYKTKHKKCAMS